MRRSPSGWATTPAPPEPVETPPEEDILDTTTTGPDGPTYGVEPPPQNRRLPVVELPSRTGGSRWWVGLHHGSGASTLAALDGSDALHGWPVHPAGQDVVVVARQTVQGLTAAQDAARDYASGRVPCLRILALVTVPAFKGKLPPELAQMLKVTAGGFPRHFTAEWHPEYMFHLDPRQVRASRHHQRILRTVHRIQKG